MDTATASANVRTIAHDGKAAPLDRALSELDDRVEALAITLDVLTVRLAPVMRDTSYDPVPGEAGEADDDVPLDTRSAAVRRVDDAAHRLTMLRVSLDELVDRLEV